MRKAVLALSLFVCAVALASCGDTTDCLCTYDNGSTTQFYDHDGDCSEIELNDLSKKMTVPGQATYVGCIDM